MRGDLLTGHGPAELGHRLGVGLERLGEGDVVVGVVAQLDLHRFTRRRGSRPARGCSGPGRGRRRSGRRPRSRSARAPGISRSKRLAAASGANSSSAPQSSSVGTPSAASLPSYGRELLEVHRAVEVERRAAPAARARTAPSRRRSRPRRTRRRRSAAGPRSPRGPAPPTSSSPCSPRIAWAIPCHLPSAKKPVSLITSAVDLVGVIAGPGEADEAAPVVDDERDRAEVERVDQPGERGEVALEVGGRGLRRSRRGRRGRGRRSAARRRRAPRISGTHISELSGKPWTSTTAGPLGSPSGSASR